MDDTKLLELAGRAAGEKFGPENNPLDRDDLALRLAVKCGINIDMDDQSAWIRRDGFFVQEYWGGDYPPCYRHAIVRAAASLGEKM